MEARDAATSGVARILVVDDEADLRAMLDITLRAEGWVVGQAASGQEALERCRHESFDILVLDHNMPGLTGIEVAHELVRDGYPAALIVFSAYLSPVLRAVCRSLGAVPVDKINWQELVLCCRSLDEERRRSGGILFDGAVTTPLFPE